MSIMNNIQNFSELVEYISNNDTPLYLAGINLLKWANENASEAEKIEFWYCFYPDFDFEDLDDRLGNSFPIDWFENAPSWDELENMEF